jgi:hypothetical protein
MPTLFISRISLKHWDKNVAPRSGHNITKASVFVDARQRRLRRT